MNIDETLTAFAALSRAAARDEAFAQKAAQGPEPRQAQLLRALAQSLAVSGRRFNLLMRGKIGDDAQNMAEAFGRGLADLAELMGSLAAGAAEAGNANAARALEQTLKVLQGAAELPESRGTPHVCGICGYIAAGQAPERCPVCGAIKAKFSPVN